VNAFLLLRILHCCFFYLNSGAVESGKEGSLYNYGVKDLFAIFFYGLICIVFHAVFQEYIFDVST